MSKRKETDGEDEVKPKKAKTDKKEKKEKKEKKGAFVCPLTGDEFLASAKPIAITINGEAFEAKPRINSSKSFGWSLSAKPTITVDGKELQTSTSLNITVKNSKPKADGKAKKGGKKGKKDDDEEDGGDDGGDE